MSFAELEKKLLRKGRLTRLDIEEELEDCYDYDFSNEVRDEINKYKDLAKLYPKKVFIIENEGDFLIKVNQNFLAKEEYKLCLYCSKNSDNNREAENLFESITGEAIKGYLGKEAKYLLIDTGNDINIEKICKEKLKEEYRKNAQKIFKDQNEPLYTDIIAWKKLDNRNGKIICLIECKSGRWKHGRSVCIDSWKAIIEFISEPIRFFAITDLATDDDLYSRGRNKGIILDRARIVSLLANVDNEEIRKIRNKIKNLRLDIL